jgi:hypothetical protein
MWICTAMPIEVFSPMRFTRRLTALARLAEKSRRG